MNLDDLLLNNKNDYITIKDMPTTYCSFCNEVETNFICYKCGIDDKKDLTPFGAKAKCVSNNLSNFKKGFS